ncbi:hypothetical protein [Streptomyces shenzhenensis]|uniref:hypothetical protein n=1 Tax=Streptomyces shenzhenensis TaxID=943815 RepID=UPI0036C6922C
MKIVKRAGERLPAWIRSEIRPVLATSGAGRALADGTRLLIQRGWHILSEHLHGWERLAAIAFGGYLAVYGCAHAPDVAKFVVPGAVVAWCVAAWCIAPPEPAEPRPPADEAAEPEPAEAAPQDVHAATLDWIRDQIGDRQGVHLRDLLEHAQTHGLFDALDVTTFRAHLERWDIPVRNRVRVRGLGVTVGIHRDDLPPRSEPSPDPDGQDPPDPELHPV